jgi:AcrR family transcriptional regulator
MAQTRTRATKLRRPAKTRIGHEIVEAILDAAAEILAERGLGGLTTNHLAERAGVSIGSLYHYFPNKEAIIAALAKRMEERAAELLAARRREVTKAVDKEQLVRSLTTTLVARELGSLATRQALLMDVPRRWVEAAGREHQTVVHRLLAELLSERESVREGNDELMAFVLAHAVRGVMEGAMIYRPDLFESPELVEEVFELVSRYTAPARPRD